MYYNGTKTDVLVVYFSSLCKNILSKWSEISAIILLILLNNNIVKYIIVCFISEDYDKIDYYYLYIIYIRVKL